MTDVLIRTGLALTMLLGTTTLAASEPFTWNPKAVKLDGTKLTADTLILGDYAQIKFTFTDPTGINATFVDVGILPIVDFMLNGRTVKPAEYNMADGWGAYVRYTGTGTQTFYAPGVPRAATFETLTYDLIGYNGQAAFGLDRDGRAVVEGSISDKVTLETGSLISGALKFELGPTGPTIFGTASTTFDELKPQFVQSNPGQFEINFVHPPGEYFSLFPDTLQIAAATGSSATLVPKQKGKNVMSASRASLAVEDGSAAATTDVPEPASLALLGAALVAAGLLRRRISRSET